MRRIIVVGGGIVGVAAAAELAERGFSVMVIEQGPRDQLIGSTGHAPGYIGTFNESPVLTALAQASVACYSELSQAGLKGFDQVGSLEIARTDTTVNDLVRRAAKAREAGLEAQLISAANAATLAPDLIDVQNCVGAVLYAKDGTARASVITSALRERATHAGACFVYDARVTDIETRGGRVNAVYTEAGRVPADDVIIACGIWGPTVAALAGYTMPLTPVAYPYVFGPVHSELFQTAPFVRWPDAHYAREHGNRLGLGTYNHVPIAVPVEELGRLEKLPWRGEPFDLAIEIAISLLPPDRQFRPAQQLNGVFSMTPDNLPLLGPISGVDGLWVAEAVWITHAAGAARMLVDMMSNRDGEIDRLTTLSPVRFEGQPVAAQEARSLRLYRDIYSTLEPKQIADTMLLLSAYRVFSFLTASAKVRAYSISAGNRMAPEFHMLDKRFPSKGK